MSKIEKHNAEFPDRKLMRIFPTDEPEYVIYIVPKDDMFTSVELNFLLNLAKKYHKLFYISKLGNGHLYGCIHGS
jgi:hypothetical protein